MKAKFRKTVSIICAGLIAMPAFAQDIRQAMDKIFSGIPAEKISTGILIERAPSFVDMYRYEEACREKDTCNVKKWKQIYLQLNAAHLDERKFKYDSRIIKQDFSEQKSKTGEIPIGIIFYDYNRISPQAVSKRLIAVDTVKNVIRDISGAGSTPLETATCFAASPMAEILQAGTYSFYIEPSLFISNKAQAFDKVEIDFGNGFVPMPAGGRVNTDFKTGGVHTLTVKATVKEKVFIACSAVYVPKTESILRAPAAADPERSPDFFDNEYEQANIEAQYGIWYRCNHDNTLRKPFLVVSGFDPGDNVRIQEDANDDKKDDRIYLYHVANKDGFLDRLRERGYDIILYRSIDSDKSITDNALNLVELIKKINGDKTADNELVMAGASMGGLVCRYALAYMEYHNIDHQTRLFVSIDSPQQGANIPLGMQHMLSSLSTGLNGLVLAGEKLDEMVDEMLGCAAARQMLLYHHSATRGNSASCAPERMGFIRSLASVGSFPEKCKSMAVSMGSGTAVGQGFSAGETLLKKDLSTIENIFLNLAGVNAAGNAISGLLGSPSWTRLIWNFEVKAVPDQTSQTIYNGNIAIKVAIFPLGIPIPINIITKDIEKTTVTVANTMSLDNVSGSIRGLHNFTDFDKYGFSDVLVFLGDLYKENSYDCFIPSYSALGLSASTDANIKNYLDSHPDVIKIGNSNHFYQNFNKTVSPFDYLYIENSNLNHIYDSDNNSAFTTAMITAMEELASPAELDLQDRTIASGQSVAYEADKVTAKNM